MITRLRISAGVGVFAPWQRSRLRQRRRFRACPVPAQGQGRTCLLMIGAATVAAVLPKKYRSSTSSVRLGRQNATLDVVATAGEAQAAANPAEIREFQVNSIAAILAAGRWSPESSTRRPRGRARRSPRRGGGGRPSPGPAARKTATDAGSASGDSLVTGGARLFTRS